MSAETGYIVLASGAVREAARHTRTDGDRTSTHVTLFARGKWGHKIARTATPAQAATFTTTHPHP